MNAKTEAKKEAYAALKDCVAQGLEYGFENVWDCLPPSIDTEAGGLAWDKAWDKAWATKSPAIFAALKAAFQTAFEAAWKEARKAV